ncbi:histidine kinase [Acetobacter aceti 1023]|nr:histidine kinase [Acetobacter aceti 1023]
MVAQAWLIMGEGAVAGAAVATLGGIVLGRMRAAASHVSVLARRSPSKEVSQPCLEQVMACLPVAMLVINESRGLCVVSKMAEQQFDGDLGSIVRHPAFQAKLDVVLAQKAENTQSDRVRVILDIPRLRVVQAVLQKQSLPAALLPISMRRENTAPNAMTTQVFVALYDETDAVVAERQYTDFVAFASHELRTPLAALLGFIETLQGPAADDPLAQKEFLEIMAQQAKRMQNLLNSLLYLSRVQMQEHQKPREVVRLADLLEQCQTEADLLAAGLPVTVDVPPVQDKNWQVAGDETQLLQVVVNLVENAIKYSLVSDKTKAGKPVSITITCQQAEPDERWPSTPGIVLSVTDNGPGIPARHLARLTERFYRVAKTAAAVQGSGLGLAIVQHIVTRHGGRFVVDSAVGQGTSCHIWLPLLPVVANPSSNCHQTVSQS